MRVLADENQHPHVVARLRAVGHEVEWIRESMRGASDEQILERADIGTWVLVTDDRDFGDLIFNRNYPVPRAILYNRMNRAHPDLIADRLVALLAMGDIDGYMTTLIKDGERSKPFPAGAENG